MFLGGLPKGEFLREFEPDFFFDDQTGHVETPRRTCRRGTWPPGIAEPAETPGSRAGRSAAGPPRSSTRTPPYSMRISCAACSVRSAWFTRWRDRPTR